MMKNLDFEDPNSVLARAQELDSAEAIIESFLQSEASRRIWISLWKVGAAM